ncbi:hypothetical protein COU54_01665 [Candidatus Pacearchaeota archaeon CG10_big_fil_rev_8_21_14_0_10_31_24]|nr:MAG: hypothetical protein COU54_01665 [Candidatus Pacearchaeota archaeon CG10_big_fil_rev_8_21_14_0_10_31_24]
MDNYEFGERFKTLLASTSKNENSRAYNSGNKSIDSEISQITDVLAGEHYKTNSEGKKTRKITIYNEKVESASNRISHLGENLAKLVENEEISFEDAKNAIKYVKKELKEFINPDRHLKRIKTIDSQERICQLSNPLNYLNAASRRINKAIKNKEARLNPKSEIEQKVQEQPLRLEPAGDQKRDYSSHPLPQSPVEIKPPPNSQLSCSQRQNNYSLDGDNSIPLPKFSMSGLKDSILNIFSYDLGNYPKISGIADNSLKTKRRPDWTKIASIGIMTSMLSWFGQVVIQDQFFKNHSSQINLHSNTTSTNKVYEYQFKIPTNRLVISKYFSHVKPKED